ncbi:hypothetical protein [Streptomyces sp. NPDC101234]|uniref:hypothetical protein n=1 Tax=Streptomyces sp. NPDC101234 TaxID=3366138 RepID=UPI0038203EF4
MNRVSAQLGCSAARVARSLDRLRELGLIARRSGRQRRYAAIDPQAAVEALVRTRWRQAVPLHGEVGDELGDEDRSLLALMAAGLKDEAIARRLGWSPRAMRRRVSALLTRLGATNRFQAGAIAARRGWP